MLILDGWGEAPDSPGNAIAKAHTPNFHKLAEKGLKTSLKASGLAVGLPPHNQGASEPGHITIGAGRIVKQPILMINEAIEKNTLSQNKVLKNILHQSKTQENNLHLMGLLSDEGVHALDQHLYALLELAKKAGLANAYIHCFLDGRDVPEQSALKYLDKLAQKIHSLNFGTIASLIGRYYAMDRDRNWDRIQKAYNLLVYGQGKVYKNYREPFPQIYQEAEQPTDYYVPPIVISNPNFPEGKMTIKTGDSLIFWNFRADRARQLSYAFYNPQNLTPSAFKTDPQLKIHLASLGQYNKKVPIPSAFPPEEVKNNLALTLAQKDIKQFRTAETEKYAHVTLFFNSQIEKPVPGEEHLLIPSPKVPSYAQKPEMSGAQVCQTICEQIKKEKYEIIIANFANPDLVGHSGKLAATIEAVENVDSWIGEIANLLQEKKGYLILLGDHGNAEQMIYPQTGEVCPAHTTNPVPFILTSWSHNNLSFSLKSGGGLANVAPTILELLKIPIPKEMTASSLLIPSSS